MEKEEFCKKLKEKGFKAGMEDNIPYVYYTDGKSPLEEIRKLVQEFQYTGTFGMKRKKQSESGEEKHSA